MQGGMDMKVIATAKFNDLEAGTIREINDIFVVSKERAKVLIKKNFAKQVVETANVNSEPEKATLKIATSQLNAKK